jgi:small multidrug resistance family-3 protein
VVSQNKEKNMNTMYWYAGAALAENSGCFALWTWLRLGRSGWATVPGTMSLIVFALLLARTDIAFAGRAYAGYGGVHIAASLL